MSTIGSASEGASDKEAAGIICRPESSSSRTPATSQLFRLVCWLLLLSSSVISLTGLFLAIRWIFAP